VDRGAIAEECRRIEKAGGSVLEHLRVLGCVSPWGTWFRLQKEELGRKDWQIRDGKGEESMAKITLEMKKKAAEIARSGGNPMEYLKQCGSKNPSAAWHYIKKSLMEADPETYTQITESEKPVTTCCAPSTREGVEVPDELPEEVIGSMTIEPSDAVRQAIKEALEDSTPEITEPVRVCGKTIPVCTKPLCYDRFVVRSVEKKGVGRFLYDEGQDLLFWTTPDGEEVSFSPADWVRIAAEELPKAMAILGISLENGENA